MRILAALFALTAVGGAGAQDRALLESAYQLTGPDNQGRACFINRYDPLDTYAAQALGGSPERVCFDNVAGQYAGFTNSPDFGRPPTPSGTEITACGVLDDGEYYLAGDLTVDATTGICLEVTGDDVTLDLAGFEIVATSSQVGNDNASSGQVLRCSAADSFTLTGGTIRQSEAANENGWNVTAVYLDDCTNYAIEDVTLHTTRSHRHRGNVLVIGGGTSLGAIRRTSISNSMDPALWAGFNVTPGAAVHMQFSLGAQSQVFEDVDVTCAASESDTPTCIWANNTGVTANNLTITNPIGGCLGGDPRNIQTVSLTSATCNGQPIVSYHSADAVVDGLDAGEVWVTGGSDVTLNSAHIRNGIYTGGGNLVLNNLRFCRTLDADGLCDEAVDSFAPGELYISQTVVTVDRAQIFAGRGWGDWHQPLQFRSGPAGTTITNADIRTTASRGLYAYQQETDGWLFDKSVFEAVSCTAGPPGIADHVQFCPENQNSIALRTCAGNGPERCRFRDVVFANHAQVSNPFNKADGSAGYVFENSVLPTLESHFIRSACNSCEDATASLTSPARVMNINPTVPTDFTARWLSAVDQVILQQGSGTPDDFVCESEIASIGSCPNSTVCVMVERPCS